MRQQNITKKKEQNLNILLIEPKHKDVAIGLPLGLAYLAAVLRKSNYNVSVLDCNIQDLDYKAVINKIKDKDIGIVGLGCTTAQINEGWRILEGLRKIRPDIITVLGGVHPTTLPEESLRKDYVDYVLKGECEYSLLKFLKAIKTKKFKDVEGISYKIIVNGKVKFYHHKEIPRVEDLNKLPLPARDLFKGFPDKYSNSIQIYKNKADILTSRGCPGACNFCSKSVHGYKFRARSPENVVDEIEFLHFSYGIDYFYILDDYFTADIKRAEKICDLILERGLKIKWTCANGIRVNKVDLGLFKKMKKSGCFRIAFGVESGSNEILKKIGKNVTIEEIRRAFDLAQQANLITIAYFIIGNIWENEQTIKETINFAKSLKTDYAQFLIAKPYPATVLYKSIENKVCGAKFLIKDWEKYDLFDSPVVFTTNELSRELLLKMHKKAYNSFYFRPKQIFFILYKRIISRRLELAQLLSLIKYFFTERR